MLNKKPQTSKRSTPIEIVHCITLAFWTYGIITPPASSQLLVKMMDGCVRKKKKKKIRARANGKTHMGGERSRVRKKFVGRMKKKRKKKKNVIPNRVIQVIHQPQRLASARCELEGGHWSTLAPHTDSMMSSLFRFEWKR